MTMDLVILVICQKLETTGRTHVRIRAHLVSTLLWAAVTTAREDGIRMKMVHGNVRNVSIALVPGLHQQAVRAIVCKISVRRANCEH